jgi:hypothetical protein
MTHHETSKMRTAAGGKKPPSFNNDTWFGFRRGVPIGYTHRRCLMPLGAFDRQCHGRSRQTCLSEHWSHGGSATGNCKRMIEYTSLKLAPYSQGEGLNGHRVGDDTTERAILTKAIDRLLPKALP